MDLDPTAAWNIEQAPHSDVVISCRARIARNIDGFPFVNRTTDAQNHELLNLSRRMLLGSELADELVWVDLHEATAHDRRLLFERHLISKNHMESKSERAVVISQDETLSIMVNEEDHLRMQVLAPGLQLEKVYHQINHVDDAVEAEIDYAFHDRWGYLTACPTNLGTGIRFSVMLQLPALRMTNEIDRVRRAANDLHLAVRGYHGEGSESAGNFYQISNQVTLGKTEEELLAEFQEAILPRIIEYELHTRKVLVEKNSVLLDDRIHRALAVLRSARMLGTEEAMNLLSRVRLGICLDRVEEINRQIIKQLFLQIQPAHLQQHLGQELSPVEMREARATIVRQMLQ